MQQYWNHCNFSMNWQSSIKEHTLCLYVYGRSNPTAEPPCRKQHLDSSHPTEAGNNCKWSQLGNGAGLIRISSEATATFALVGTDSRVACTKVGICIPTIALQGHADPGVLRLPWKNRRLSTKEREFTVKFYRFVSWVLSVSQELKLWKA